MSAVELNSDVPAAVLLLASARVEVMDVAGVMIGIDPHKGSHTAFAIDGREKQLGQVRVRACARQAEVLLQWAAGWPTRSWAIEGARGLGLLLAQQLIAADQRVLDVPPKLAARVRLLGSGQINKNDENDARSVAIAALRGHDLPVLSGQDQTMVMRVWSRRYHDLGRLRTQVICRLHTVLCELVPGGVRKQLRTSHASEVVAGLVADSPIAQAKLELAHELVADLQHVRGGVTYRRDIWVAHHGTSVLHDTGLGDGQGYISLGPAVFPAGSTSLTWDQLMALPTNPDQLKAVLRSDINGAGNGDNAELFVMVGDLLRESPAPPALREALYNLAASIPNVRVNGQVTDAAGRTGTAVARDGQTLLIDTTTGQLLADTEEGFTATYLNQGPANTAPATTGN